MFQMELAVQVKHLNISLTHYHLINANLYIRINNDFNDTKYFIGLFDAIGSGRVAAIKYYKKWIDQVKRTVPKDRLLIYNIDEGWEPLCRFLNKPKPNCPFPFIDDIVEIENNQPSLKMISYLSIFILPILISLLLAYNYNIRLKNK